MKIKKAVIPAAGLGTRVLPASKSIPKEMLPIVDKPAIQYIVEEAVDSGIKEILIITNRGKEAIEDHFDYSPELEAALEKSEKTDLLESVRKCANLADIFFLRQREIKGLGHAIFTARPFVGNEPFAVLFGDDVIISKTPVTKQLIDVFLKKSLTTLGIKEVKESDISKFSSLSVKNLEDNIFFVDDMVEKPEIGKHLSLYSILGRCILTPEIFDLLEDLPPGVGGEIQLIDAIKIIANRDGCIGVDFEGTRYDLGNKFGMLKANIEVALNHPEISEEVREYLAGLKID
ncbi:MAG: UTP--glucose-1-phosphate uridylyltransferase GalU [Ruminococcaceae bacterium]|nr:UTP--glucose-1-phosphate uridylyltransferase GalU [Oscillospiraceae bacterium]